MTHTYLTKILVLPDAGPKNPFQYQMIKYLREHGFAVSPGKKRKLFSIYMAVKSSKPEIIYFDWIHGFIIGKSLPGSCIKSLFFCLEIFYLIYIKKLPIVHTAHNIQNHKQKWLVPERWIYRFFLRNCCRIRVYSEGIKKEIISKFSLEPNRIYVIRDIPFHHHYPNFTTQTQGRIWLGIDRSAFLYLFFGRIEPYKGLENLIHSFISITKPDSYLILAGESLDHKYLSDLQKLTKKHARIIWHNRFIVEEEVQYLFNAADVAVFPFTRIDHSGSVDLALSFSKPVITLKTKAMADLLSHQDPLLFETPGQLTNCLSQAEKNDLSAIGYQNFKIADAANFSDLLKLFQMSKS